MSFPRYQVLAVVLGILAVLAGPTTLAGCGATTDPAAAQVAHARATLTASARATQIVVAAASQTAAALPLIPLPYMAAAPGPGCDTAGASWTAQTAQGVTCLASPGRLRLTALPDAAGNCCQNEVDWALGQTGRLPASYRVSVQISGLLGQTHAGETNIMGSLFLNLRTPAGADTSFRIGFTVVAGSSAKYLIYLDGFESGFVTYDPANLTKPATISIEVKDSDGSGAINGITELHRSVTIPYTVTGIALKMSGPSGTHADFANLRVEQP